MSKKKFNKLFKSFMKDLSINLFTKKGEKNIKSDLKNLDSDRTKKIIDNLSQFKNGSDNVEFNEYLDHEIKDTLGKPDMTQFFVQDGMYLTKETWYTDQGEIVKVSVSESPTSGHNSGENNIANGNPFNGIPLEGIPLDILKNMSSFLDFKDIIFPQQLTLDEQLTDALLSEDYTEAIRLRDLINNAKKQ